MCVCVRIGAKAILCCFKMCPCPVGWVVTWSLRDFSVYSPQHSLEGSGKCILRPLLFLSRTLFVARSGFHC